jgi:hypothetical protein
MKVSIAAVCEYALESRGRWTLVGTFRAMDCPEFPLTVPRLEVYLLFVNVRGVDLNEVTLNLYESVSLEAFETALPLVSMKAPAQAEPFEGAYHVCFRFQDVVFAKASRYDFEVEVEKKTVELIPVFVRSSR